MALTRIIGDIHGKFNDYVDVLQRATDAGIERSVQVGDFGIGFAGPYWHDQVDKFHRDNPGHKFIRGNHDNPARCKSMVGYISDGTVLNDVMLIGGAWSIDFAWRTEGVNWWADEELSTKDLYLLMDVYDMVKPRVVITHDCPTDVARQMFIAPSGKQLAHKPVQYKTRTAEAFQAMWEMHQPEIWCFGHWHISQLEVMNGTAFRCIGECDFVDIDM